MGINVNGALFLAYAKSLGVDFRRTMMIGRQNLYLTHEEMAYALGAFGQRPDADVLTEICDGSAGFSDNLLRHLGARDVHALDYSSYQSPTHIHDMNEPVIESMNEQYTVVLDGGSLEHVFNFPVAIRNCMEMLAVGGHYLAITPANNFFGHGFYQFSPELYFTVLSQENGYHVERMIAFEEVERPTWYTVKSPREAGGRVTLSNAKPVYLLVIARRVAKIPIFQKPPVQSDYAALWNAATVEAREPKAGTSSNRPLPIRLAKVILPVELRRFLRSVVTPRPRPRGSVRFDPEFFTPMDLPLNQR